MAKYQDFLDTFEKEKSPGRPVGDSKGNTVMYRGVQKYLDGDLAGAKVDLTEAKQLGISGNTNLAYAIDTIEREGKAIARIEAENVAEPVKETSRPANYLDEFIREDEGLSESYKNMPATDPDYSARIINVAKKTGQSEDFVEENLPEAEIAAKAKPSEYWAQVERDYPGTTRWLYEGNNMAVAHDDVDNLGMRERLIDDVGESMELLLDPGKRILAADRAFRGAIKKVPAGFTSGTMQVRQSELGWSQAIHALSTDEHDPTFDPELEGIEKRLAEYQEKAPKINLFYHAAAQVPNLLMIGRYGAKRAMQGGMVFGLGAVALGQIPPLTGLPEEFVTVPAATALGMTTGGRIGAFEAMAVLEGGTAYREFAALKDKNGNQVSPRLAAEMALAVGIANAGLEYASLTALLRTIPGGDRILGHFSAKGGLFKGLTLPSAIRAAAKRYLVNVGTETITEPTQEAVAIAVGEAGKAISGQPFEPMPWKERWQRIGGVISPAAQASMLLGIPGTAVHIAGEINKFQQTDIGREGYSRLGEMAGKSKLAERCPEAFADHLNNLTVGTRLQDVYIPAEAFNDYCKKNGLDPKELSAKLGIDTLYQEAIESKGDIKMLSGDWAVQSKRVGDEIGRNLYQELEEDVKLDPESYTSRQRTELSQGYLEQFEKAADQIISKDPAQKEVKQQIYDQSLQELIAAGRPEKEAAAEAQILSNMVFTLSVRQNITPAEARNTLISRIQGAEDIEAPGVRVTPDITETNIDAARKKLYSSTKAEISTQPAYLASEFLRKKMGPGYRKIAIRAREADKISKEHRFLFESAADAFGLGDAESLLKLISEIPTREEAIKDMVETKLSSTFGDPRLYQYASEQLTKAKEMFDADKPADEIQANTGWVNEAGQWRYSPVMGIFGPDALYQLKPTVEIKDAGLGRYKITGIGVAPKVFNSLNEAQKEAERIRRGIGEYQHVSPIVKTEKPSDDLLNAKYDAPESVPENVYRYIMSQTQLLTADATDAVRWSRIIGTENDKRYPSGNLKIYRAGGGNEILPGDWVTTDRKYAESHLNKYLGGKGAVIEETVDGKDVLVSPTGDAEEAIYAPMKYSGDVFGPDALYQMAPPTESEAFKKWFGNSKVVDDEGKPLVVYHGTTAQFESFGLASRGKLTEAPSARMAFFFSGESKTAEGYTELGAGRLADELKIKTDAAERKAQRTGKNSDWDKHNELYGEYEQAVMANEQSGLRGNVGANVMPVYLSMKNPLVHDFKGSEYREESYAELIKEAKKSGHDGVIFKNTYDPGTFQNIKTDVYGAFEPTQIKSIYNPGRFGLTNPDVMYQMVPSVKEISDLIGKEMVGYRYGKAPKGGKSYNTATGNYESGVSMASTGYLEEKKSFAVMNLSEKGVKKYFYIGQIAGEGGDGEMTLSSIEEISENKYKSKLKDENIIQTSNEIIDAIANRRIFLIGAGWNIQRTKEEVEKWRIANKRGRFDPANPDIMYQKAEGAGEVAVIQGAAKPEVEAYQSDLFGAPVEIQKPDKKQARYATRTEMVTEGVREIGAEVINTPKEAAQAMAYLGREAVERFDAVITNKDGKPLAIVGSFKGRVDQVPLPMLTITSEAFRINDAANIWFAHNHPSGDPDFSKMDIDMGKKIDASFAGSGITPRGFFAISGGPSEGVREWAFRGEDGAISHGKTKPSTQRKKIQVMERIITEHAKLAPRITNIANAKEAALTLAGNESGALLLDTKHAPVAFFPILPGEADTLRTAGRMDALYRSLSISNAAAVIIVDNGIGRAGNINLSGFFNSVEVRVLDVIVNDAGTDKRFSWAEKGLKLSTFKTFRQAAAGAFDPRTRDVVLSFKKANASTFIHETAHAWLSLVDEMVKDGRASESLIDDHTKLMAWLGAEYDKPLTKAQQEKFAASFEAYLREGKAPTAELRPAFARFKRWLTLIYRSIQDIGAGILGEEGVSEEVRGIMDRMLATEYEISSAEQIMAPSGKMEFAWLDPKVQAKLDKLRQQAHDEATDKLLKQQMAEIAEDRQAFLTSERQRITDEITETLKKDKLHLAITGMADSEGEAKALAEKFLAGELEEGSNDWAGFEIGAELLDFYSGQELAKKIIAKPAFEQEVSGAVDSRMNEAYADLKDTDAIRTEAVNAVHGDRQLEVLALEREILKSKVEDAQGKAEAHRYTMTKIWMEAEIAKARALEVVSKLKIGEIKSPEKYFTAERIAAVRVAKAMARKDYGKAAAHKHTQMLNHALGMAVIKAGKQIEKALGQIEKISSLKPDKLVDQETYIQVQQILYRFGFMNSSGKFERKETLTQYLKRSMQAFQGDEKDESTPIDIPDWMADEATNIFTKNLTPGQLFDVLNTLKNIIHTAKMMGKFYALAEKGRVGELAGRLADEARKNVKRKKKGRAVEGKRERAKAVSENYMFGLEQIDTVINRLDGFEDFGMWYKSLASPIKDAADSESSRRWALIGELDKIWGVYTPTEINNISTKKIVIPEFGLDNKNPFYKHQLFAMALNLGNRVNREKLMNTEPVNLNPDFNWTENRENTDRIVMSVLQQHLDKRDWQFIQNIWKLIGSLKEEAFALHKRVTGFEPQSVEALPFEVVLPTGERITMEGGYYPLDEDPRHSEAAAERELLNQPLYKESNPGFKAMTKTGHTKARTGAQYAVSLRLSLISRHLNDVIHDIYFRELVIDLRRLAAHQGFIAGVKETTGDNGYRYIDTWIKSVATGRNAEKYSSDAISTVVRGLTRHAATSIILMRVAVILQNFANPFLAAGRVEGFGHGDALKAILVRGVFDYWAKCSLQPTGWKAAAEMRERVWALSSFMRDRRENPAYTLKLYSGVASKLGMSGKVRDFTIGLLAGSDDMTNIPVWITAFEKKMKETGNERQSVKYADLLISRVTPSARKYDVAQILRSGQDAVKLFTVFYSFWNVEYNNWVRELGKQGRAPIKNAPRFMGFVASRMMFVFVSAILANHHPEPEWDFKKKVAWWAKEYAMYPISFFPFFRDIAGLVLDNSLGLPSYGYRPFILGSAVEDTGRAANQIRKRIIGEESNQKLIESLTDIASVALPYPAQLNAWFFNAYDYITNGMEPVFEDLYKRRPVRKR